MSLLEMHDIQKEFPGVRALDGVDFTLEKGEFHALVGENGAGKSTLMKVLSGVYPAGDFTGRIEIEGREAEFSNVRSSENAGIAVIFQELSLVKELSVGENIFLGRAPSRFGVIDWAKLYRDSANVLAELGLAIDPRVKAGTLGIGQQQLVEIAKALSRNARILVLDEPTAALSDAEVASLFSILKDLKARGVGMIYISHRLDEVFRMSDRITVLRDGRTVATHEANATNKNEIIAEMVGREVTDIFPRIEHEMGDVVFDVSGLDVYSPDEPDKKLVDDVSFRVHAGEVLGIAGLMGAGRSELLSAIFGAWQGKYSVRLELEGRRLSVSSPREAIEAGIAFVTEDRKRYGLVLERSILDNMTLAALRNVSGRLFTDRERERRAAASPMRSLRIKAPSVETAVNTLSGGNQQKVVLAKWLLTEPKVLFLDEPTRGIDVGAKQEIYSEINKLAKTGLAIVLVSSELPEILGLSDRIVVLHEGRKTAEFTRAEADAERVMAAATGQTFANRDLSE